MFTRILVCLDGSELAEQILPYVAELSLRFKSKVTLLQVIASTAAMGTPAVTMPPSYTFPLTRDIQDSVARSVKGYLESVAERLRGKGTYVDTDVIEGTAGQAIVRFADDHAADLIALATQGHSGLRRMVFGSVADFVVRESGLPILLITPSGEAQ
jgi:nucleotide-binding universal stress UspA family protein